MAQILLNMIVKNEGEIITRLLESVTDIIDALVICDTGSTDQTIAIIENWASSKNIPHRVVKDSWVNFGTNRTNAIFHAKEFIIENGNLLKNWYLLFLDADMQLKIDSSFFKSPLNYPAYNIKQFTAGGLEYYNARLVRADVEMKYVCPTHEYLETKGIASTILDSLQIFDIGDGGAKTDKYERDIKLLTEALEQEPGNPRYLFYLANSYFDIGNYTAAKQYYQARYEANGWSEERWFAKYKWGLCLLNLDAIKDAEDILLQAFEERPWRAEPIYQLALFYHKKNDHARAYMYASLALKLNDTKDDILFIDSYGNGNGPVEIISVHAYYLLFFEEGQKCTEKLIADYPGVERHEQNLQYYKNINQI